MFRRLLLTAHIGVNLGGNSVTVAFDFTKAQNQTGLYNRETAGQSKDISEFEKNLSYDVGPHYKKTKAKACFKIPIPADKTALQKKREPI